MTAMRWCARRAAAGLGATITPIKLGEAVRGLDIYAIGGGGRRADLAVEHLAKDGGLRARLRRAADSGDAPVSRSSASRSARAQGVGPRAARLRHHVAADQGHRRDPHGTAFRRADRHLDGLRKPHGPDHARRGRRPWAGSSAAWVTRAERQRTGRAPDPVRGRRGGRKRRQAESPRPRPAARKARCGAASWPPTCMGRCWRESRAGGSAAGAGDGRGRRVARALDLPVIGRLRAERIASKPRPKSER